MTSLQKLREFGESMGLKGEVLYDFIKEQQAEKKSFESRIQRTSEKRKRVRSRKDKVTAGTVFVRMA